MRLHQGCEPAPLLKRYVASERPTDAVKPPPARNGRERGRRKAGAGDHLGLALQHARRRVSTARILEIGADTIGLLEILARRTLATDAAMNPLARPAAPAPPPHNGATVERAAQLTSSPSS